jgi:Ribosome recycling factor
MLQESSSILCFTGAVLLLHALTDTTAIYAFVTTCAVHVHCSASQLMVEAYDRTALTAIERAIIESGVGLTPNNDGQVIRLNVPPVTEDRRYAL